MTESIRHRPGRLDDRGTNTGAVRGSILWDAASNTLTFVKTGSPLASDTYTATLFSRGDGFKSSSGELLDGDSNGIAGGNFVTTFAIASSTARIVSIPDFSRGSTTTAGQSVNLSFDNGNPGLPVTLSDGAGVLAIDFDVVFNPTCSTSRVPSLAFCRLDGARPST